MKVSIEGKDIDPLLGVASVRKPKWKIQNIEFVTIESYQSGKKDIIEKQPEENASTKKIYREVFVEKALTGVFKSQISRHLLNGNRKLRSTDQWQKKVPTTICKSEKEFVNQIKLFSKAQSTEFKHEKTQPINSFDKIFNSIQNFNNYKFGDSEVEKKCCNYYPLGANMKMKEFINQENKGPKTLLSIEMRERNLKPGNLTPKTR